MPQQLLHFLFVVWRHPHRNEVAGLAVTQQHEGVGIRGRGEVPGTGEHRA